MAAVSRHVKIVNGNHIKVHIEEDDAFMKNCNLAGIRGNYPMPSSSGTG